MSISPMLSEKLEKLRTKDDEISNDDCTSEEEEEVDPFGKDYVSFYRTYRLLEKSKEIIQCFLRQVKENRLADDMSRPHYPDPNVYLFMRLYVKNFDDKVDPVIEREFLDQVRKSWGYDVEGLPPRMIPCIYPIDLMNNELGVSTYVDFLKRTTECVIDRINSGAEEIGKHFELVRVNKVVSVSRELYLLTLTIKDEANAGKIIQAKVSMREEEQLFVCSRCAVQRRPVLLSCNLLSTV